MTAKPVLVSVMIAAGIRMEALADEPIDAPDKQASAAADQSLDFIAISVRDSASAKPIARFRVLAGVKSGAGISEEFKKRTGQEPANWQPHTLRVGEDGVCFWPLKPTYDEMALRVDADGYQPINSAWITKGQEPEVLAFSLVRDPGVRGRVLQPDGKPAAGATVAIALPQRDAVIENGRLRGEADPPPVNESDRWRIPTFVKTDEKGRFRLPTETDAAAAVLVLHESGVREMTNSDFLKQPEIALARWGLVEGQVLWKDKPGADEPISLSSDREEYGYPGMIHSYAETRSDVQGKFVFDKVLPGRAQITRYIQVPEQGKSGATSASAEGLYLHVKIRAGEPTVTLLGGQGRKVTGRLIGRDSWDGVTFHFHPTAPHFGLTGDEEIWKAWGIFQNSTIGPLFFRGKLKPNADGTFEITDVLPGRYQFYVSAPGLQSDIAYKKIDVAPETPGQLPLPLDLGEIKVKPPNDAAPKADAKPENAAD